jgi:hypothetical protein
MMIACLDFAPHSSHNSYQSQMAAIHLTRMYSVKCEISPTKIERPVLSLSIGDICRELIHTDCALNFLSASKLTTTTSLTDHPNLSQTR